MVLGAVSGCKRQGHDGETPERVANDITASEVQATRVNVTPNETNRPSLPEPDVARPTPVIYLLVLGQPLPEPELDYVEAALRLYFPNPLARLPIEPLPQSAYYAPRRRYRAERLLDYLERRTPEDAQVMMGLTQADISTTKGDVYDWGVLGLATLSGRQCVISSFRTARGAKDVMQARQRLTKTVIHEVGHAIGLPHCPNYGCIMEDGKGSVLTTDHEQDVCATCRGKVGQLMLAPPSRLPW